MGSNEIPFLLNVCNNIYDLLLVCGSSIVSPLYKIKHQILYGRGGTRLNSIGGDHRWLCLLVPLMLSEKNNFVGFIIKKKVYAYCAMQIY